MISAQDAKANTFQHTTFMPMVTSHHWRCLSVVWIVGGIQMNKFQCDKCEKELKLTQLNTNLVDHLPNNIDRFYLECPHCKQQYTSYFLNDEMKKIQVQIKMLHKKG